MGEFTSPLILVQMSKTLLIAVVRTTYIHTYMVIGFNGDMLIFETSEKFCLTENLGKMKWLCGQTCGSCPSSVVAMPRNRHCYIGSSSARILPRYRSPLIANVQYTSRIFPTDHSPRTATKKMKVILPLPVMHGFCSLCKYHEH